MVVKTLSLIALSWIVLLPGARLESAWFNRGDMNTSGTVNITDAIGILRYLYLSQAASFTCLEAADVDDDGNIDLTDAIRLLTYLFLHGPPPAEPFRTCGLDPTDDSLGCLQDDACVGGDAIIFCCKKSGSMAGAPWERVQQEVTKYISQFTEGVQFAIIAYDANIAVFPPFGKPARASEEMKNGAVTFINSTTTGSGSCTKPALLLALRFASLCTGRKVIIFLSDGHNTCPGHDEAQYAQEVLDEVGAANVEQVHINAMAIGFTGNVDEAFMRSLAAGNYGTYARVFP